MLGLVAAFALCGYRAITGAFFPSSEVMWLAVPPAFVGAIWFTVKGTRAVLRRGHPKELQNRWFRRLFVYPVMPLALGWTIWLSLAKGAAGFGHGLVGTSGEEGLTVASKQEHPGRSCRHALYLDELRGPGGGYFPLCVSREAFEATAVGSQVRARVRRSLLGASVE